MRRLIKYLIICFLLCCACIEAKAQFYSFGQDPASARWKEIETSNYRIVYPVGVDSIARFIGANLEYYRDSESVKLGFKPGELFKKKWPVIIHPYSCYSNGVVSLAPNRMELLTSPLAYSPLSTPWITDLALHEGRHVAQLQYSKQKRYLVFNVLFGQLFGGAMAGLYCNPSILEGDAVWAETHFTYGGRGRSDDFLEYYKVCFDGNDKRDFWQWRYGSMKNFTPNHYAFGYITTPIFIEEYYKILRTKFLPFFVTQRSIKASTGKNVRAAFEDIKDSLHRVWQANEIERKPYLQPRKITHLENAFVQYNCPVVANGRIVSKKSGTDRSSEVVEILSDGRSKHLCYIPAESSQLAVASDGSVYWSELKKDLRWSLKSSSVICRLTADNKLNIVAGGRYFNPSVSEDGKRLAVAEYLENGICRVVVLDASDGSRLSEFEAPSGLQPVETAWVGDTVFVSGITNCGFAIYNVNDAFSRVCAPMSKKIKDFRSFDGRLVFSTDLNGVFELHMLGDEGNVYRLTSSKNGGSGYFLTADSLIFSVLSKEGRMLCAANVNPLRAEKVSYESPSPLPVPVVCDSTFESATTNYSKGAHLFKFHSWAPLYVDIDQVSSLSFDKLSSVAYFGATAFFQNELSTMTGYVAYKVPHAFKANFTYSGLYPVMSLSVEGGEKGNGFTGSFQTYIPFNLSSHGWNRGVVPQFSAAINSLKDNGTPFNLFSASLRAYSVLNVPTNCIYPRWGIGAEAGYRFRFGMSEKHKNIGYGYIYGYLPGIARTHGIKLSYLAQTASSTKYDVSTTFNASYAMPLLALDWSFLCPVTYIRNLELTANYTRTAYYGNSVKTAFNAAGADLVFRLGNLVWLPFTSRIGVSYLYNFNLTDKSKHTVALLLSVDI